jgi:hypothetical protein
MLDARRREFITLVRLGLVASLARPGGNLTGINFVNAELVANGWSFCVSWCRGQLALRCSSIRPMQQQSPPHYETWKWLPAPSGFNCTGARSRTLPYYTNAHKY